MSNCNIFNCLPEHHHYYTNYYNKDNKSVYSNLPETNKYNQKRSTTEEEEEEELVNIFNVDKKFLFPGSDYQEMYRNIKNKYIILLNQGGGDVRGYEIQFNQHFFHESCVLITGLMRQLILLVINYGIKEKEKELVLILNEFGDTLNYIVEQLNILYNKTLNVKNKNGLIELLGISFQSMLKMSSYLNMTNGILDESNNTKYLIGDNGSEKIDYKEYHHLEHSISDIIDNIVKLFKNDLINDIYFLNRLKKVLLEYYNLIYDEMLLESRGDQLNSFLKHEKAIKKVSDVVQVFISYYNIK
jgi:hypothetical protein